MSAPDKSRITGLILAGGRGERMGHTDKGLLPFRGKPLFLHAAERLAPQVSTLLINANQNTARYAEAGFTVITDEPPLYAGPLAGFAAGLRHCETPYLVTVPCDSPFFPDNLVESLTTTLLQENADIAIAATGASPPFAIQPVFCLIRREYLPHLEAFLQTGQRKIDAWFASLKVVTAHFDDAAAFENINTPEALKRLDI